MSVFYLNIDKRLSIKVVPETRVYMDGHPILTYSYSLYRRSDADDLEVIMSQDDQTKQSDPNYLGFVTFEIPGRVFHYVADGQEALPAEEVELIVEHITYYRDRPDLWNKTHVE